MDRWATHHSWATPLNVPLPFLVRADNPSAVGDWHREERKRQSGPRAGQERAPLSPEASPFPDSPDGGGTREKERERERREHGGGRRLRLRNPTANNSLARSVPPDLQTVPPAANKALCITSVPLTGPS
ncbi:unnamed protein product [Pleuronectes platessa]|uniref:Uncharacterized protein n=1 Tax=Pleuronectes platessa TaxID=8262 RepID=A0A9N7Y557_PLEPL|nr:unnamed protein product [Pleuronectes platessa]